MRGNQLGFDSKSRYGCSLKRIVELKNLQKLLGVLAPTG